MEKRAFHTEVPYSSTVTSIQHCTPCGASSASRLLEHPRSGILFNAIEAALASSIEKPSIEDFFDINAIRDGRFLSNVGDGNESERRDRIVAIVSDSASGSAPRLDLAGDQNAKKRVVSYALFE